MIVDSSAIIAMIRDESDAADLRARLRSARERQMSAASYLESGIVVDRAGGPEGSRSLDRLIAELKIEIVPVTPEQARIARQAYREYGRGSGHPARLNFGDCFAYALAIDTDEPLLFNGEDFGHTDVRVA